MNHSVLYNHFYSMMFVCCNFDTISKLSDPELCNTRKVLINPTYPCFIKKKNHSFIKSLTYKIIDNFILPQYSFPTANTTFVKFIEYQFNPRFITFINI